MGILFLSGHKVKRQAKRVVVSDSSDGPICRGLVASLE
jgi:hypothetical protein